MQTSHRIKLTLDLSKDQSHLQRGYRQTWSNAFGQLIEADEPDSSGSLTLGTCYKYDTLGNLTEVDQGSQTRTFSYDTLSRLTTESTPEAGTVNYYYTTSGGALCAGNPKALCRMTDARSITTTYTYDAENRLTGKSFSNSDPSVTYSYDSTSACGGQTANNGRGRRTGMSDASGQTSWCYDAGGRVIAETRTIAGVTKTLSYTYDPGGTLQTIVYPSGLKIRNFYDLAGHPTSIYCVTPAYNGIDPDQSDPNSSPICTSLNTQAAYFAYNAQYAPQGAPSSVVLGTMGTWNGGGYTMSGGVTGTYTYNSRGC